MKNGIDRRFLLRTLAGSAVVAAVTKAKASSTNLLGVISFEGDGIIPKGELQIYVENLPDTDTAQRRDAGTILQSDGGTRAIDFSLSLPMHPAPLADAQIVAVLTRADGWLLARGSASLTPDASVNLILYKALY